jgi:hypothetical protein
MPDRDAFVQPYARCKQWLRRSNNNWQWRQARRASEECVVLAGWRSVVEHPVLRSKTCAEQLSQPLKQHSGVLRVELAATAIP